MTDPKRLSRRQLLKMAAAAGGALATVPILQACGSSASPGSSPSASSKASTSASGSPSASASAAASPKASGKPLKIGLLLPYSGVYAVPGESITNGTLLAFQEANMTAGGRKIEYIKEDTEVKPDVGLRKIRKLVEQDEVDLVTGIVSSAVALAVRDYCDQNKVVLAISNAGAVDLSRSKKSKYIVRSSFSNWQWNWAIGPYIYEKVAKEAVLAASDYAAGHEHVEGFKESFVKAGGKIVGEVYPPFPNQDFGPFLSKIQAFNAPLCYVFFAGSDALGFVKQFSEFGLKSKMKLAGSGSTVDDDVLSQEGEAAVGFINGMDWAQTLDTPENKKFMSDFKAKFNGLPDAYAARGYDTGKMIVEAVNKLGGDTSNKDKLSETMVGVKFRGPCGDFAIDPETNNIIMDVYFREVKMVDGKPANVIFQTVKGVKDPGK